jgi:hypothetical protein
MLSVRRSLSPGECKAARKAALSAIAAATKKAAEKARHRRRNDKPTISRAAALAAASAACCNVVMTTRQAADKADAEAAEARKRAETDFNGLSSAELNYAQRPLIGPSHIVFSDAYMRVIAAYKHAAAAKMCADAAKMCADAAEKHYLKQKHDVVKRYLALDAKTA